MGESPSTPRPILLYNEFGCLTSSQGNQTPQDCSSTFLRRDVAPEFANNKINSLINDTLDPMSAGGTFIQLLRCLLIAIAYSASFGTEAIPRPLYFF